MILVNMPQKVGINMSLVNTPQTVGINVSLANMQRKVDIYKRDFSWKQPFLLRIPHAPPSLAISGSHENVLKCKVFRVQKPVLLPISFRPSTHSPEPAHSPPNSPRSFIRYIHRNTPFPSARSAKKNMVLYLAYYIYILI